MTMDSSDRGTLGRILKPVALALLVVAPMVLGGCGQAAKRPDPVRDDGNDDGDEHNEKECFNWRFIFHFFLNRLLG